MLQSDWMLSGACADSKPTEKSASDLDNRQDRAELQPSRILLLEDSPDDEELVRRILQREWPRLELLVVRTRLEFEAVLKRGDFDVILSDYHIPAYSGGEALAHSIELRPAIPFIFISGVMREDLAVESLKAGATDYVLKDRLARLTPAIRRALGEARERARRQRAEHSRHLSELELARSNRVLQRRTEEIQRFYHTLSHELKTPLTVATEFISIVMDGLAGPFTGRQRELLGIAREGCNQLRRCLDDLLDTTRLDTGKLGLVLKPVSLAKLARWSASALQPACERKQVTIQVAASDELPLVSADEQRILQVLANLLTNAIKHTPSGGKICVKVEQPNPGTLRVTVSDTGRGIPAEEQDRIFERLYQIHAGDASSEQGIGLGLYLCRELVQLHGGQIGVESAPEKGSSFWFDLPAMEQPQARSRHRATPMATLAEKRRTSPRMHFYETNTDRGR